jgi:signal transduction histidine kinase
MNVSSKSNLVGSAANSNERTLRKFLLLADRLIPAELLLEPELARRARLISSFGLLGSIFGIVYAIFYLLIGHIWGALIILICSSCYIVSPYIMRRKKAVEPAGNLLVLTLVLGFTSLCFIEGGLQGHAIAWLVSVPLCAFLLLGEKSAIRWVIISFLAAGVVAGLDLAGLKFAVTYNPKWSSVVSTAGYLGLIIFMFILGMIFEGGRARAFAKMQEALAKLASSNERLVHLNNEKNEFLGIAAHDLKNPLTAIAGNAELVGMTKDQNQINKLSRNISDAAKRMHGLITNLLDINAIEREGFKFTLEPCDIHELVSQSVENNQMVATRKNIELRVGPAVGILVNADRSAVLQILDNLVSNALKYSLPKSTVHIHTLAEGDRALVTVRDEGPGISESDQKKLFQKFTRLGPRPTGGESSTGLGLAIVKQLTEAMSGTIQCHSSPGAGSTFTLRLPIITAIPVPQKLASQRFEKMPDRAVIPKTNFFLFCQKLKV